MEACPTASNQKPNEASNRNLHQTIEEGGTDYRYEPGDHEERFSHYVDKDKLGTEALVVGTPGDRPVRQGLGAVPRPTRFPVCPACKRLFNMGP